MRKRARRLAEWLATRAEEVGEHAIALEAMRVAVEDAPTLEKYLRLEQLAGAQWAQIRPKVLRHIRDNFVDEEIAAIYIHEGMYADALAILCESYALTPALARQIVDHEPASTRAACLEEANEIILNAHSRDYPLAADWLEVVKRSYYAEGKPHGVGGVHPDPYGTTQAQDRADPAAAQACRRGVETALCHTEWNAQ
jgi:hypothetical protein